MIATAKPLPLLLGVAFALWTTVFGVATVATAQTRPQTTDQTAQRSNALRRREADNLLGAARGELQRGNFTAAESFIVRAERLGVKYDSLFERYAYTPQRARRDLDLARQKSGVSQIRPGQGQRRTITNPYANQGGVSRLAGNQSQSRLPLTSPGNGSVRMSLSDSPNRALPSRAGQPTGMAPMRITDQGQPLAGRQQRRPVSPTLGGSAPPLFAGGPSAPLPNSRTVPAMADPRNVRYPIGQLGFAPPQAGQSVLPTASQEPIGSQDLFSVEPLDVPAALDSADLVRQGNRAFSQQTQPPLAQPLAPPSRLDSSTLEAVGNEQQVNLARFHDELSHEISNALSERTRARDPDGARRRLEELRGRITQAQLQPNAHRQFMSRIDRAVSSLDQYITANRATIELQRRNAAVKDEISDNRRVRLEVGQELADLTTKFNTLMDQNQFAEAELVARQARAIAPEEPVVQNMLWKSRFVRRHQIGKTIDETYEDRFVTNLMDVKNASIPLDPSKPLQFQPNWDQLTQRRAKTVGRFRSEPTAAEVQIRAALEKLVDVQFSATPLGEVLETLAAEAGVNLLIDPYGLSEEAGINSSDPITINLTQKIKLKNALRHILEPLRLTYVVQDEVLKVTGESSRNQNMYPKTYYVGDLVIPIPNFVTGPNSGMAGAMAEANARMRFAPNRNSGFDFPVIAPAIPLPDGAGVQSTSANVLAQPGLGQSPGLLGGRKRTGPGGLGGGAQADFDQLIDLILDTVSPESWVEAGGQGSIREYENNLSLVVSNTLENHEAIADLLQQLRRLQDLQVTIEVRFITLSDRFFERMGIDFDFDIDDKSSFTSDTDLENRDGGPSMVIGLDPTGAPTADLDLSFSQDSFGATIPQFGGFDPTTAANFGFAILSDIEAFFLIQAAQGDARTNVLQAPKITLFNGQQATISDTTQKTFVTGLTPVVGDFAAAQQPVITVLNEGTTLNVQGVVSPDRRFVRLTVVPIFSRVGQVNEFTFVGSETSNSGSVAIDPSTNEPINDRNDVVTTTESSTVQQPEFSQVNISTTVSVPDGGTILLGGIKRLSEGRTERGVPVLSKLPFINRLFRNVGIGRETSTLMMMVTPRIIIQEEEEALLGMDIE